jgi:hypothetical protein
MSTLSVRRASEDCINPEKDVCHTRHRIVDLNNDAIPVTMRVVCN